MVLQLGLVVLYLTMADGCRRPPGACAWSSSRCWRCCCFGSACAAYRPRDRPGAARGASLLHAKSLVCARWPPARSPRCSSSRSSAYKPVRFYAEELASVTQRVPPKGARLRRAPRPDGRADHRPARPHRDDVPVPQRAGGLRSAGRSSRHSGNLSSPGRLRRTVRWRRASGSWSPRGSGGGRRRQQLRVFTARGGWLKFGVAGAVGVSVLEGVGVRTVVTYRRLAPLSRSTRVDLGDGRPPVGLDDPRRFRIMLLEVGMMILAIPAAVVAGLRRPSDSGAIITAGDGLRL